MSAGGPLPDFIVIGAMRAATTTLHRYLDAHPEIGMSLEKETDFFVEELNYGRGFAWYAGLFPKDARFRGESSTNYAKRDVFPGVPERIHAALPGVRLVYVVRDPVKRAVSHYTFSVNSGRDPSSPTLVRHVIETSRYAWQLEAYAAVFPPGQILVLDYDTLSATPEAALAQVGGFLGLSAPWPPIDDGRDNDSGRLSRMPLWFLRLRRNPIVNDLRRGLPMGLRRRLRQAVELGPSREAAVVTDDLVARFRDGIAEDAQRFRAMTGQPFERWSV